MSRVPLRHRLGLDHNIQAFLEIMYNIQPCEQAVLTCCESNLYLRDKHDLLFEVFGRPEPMQRLGIRWHFVQQD